MTSSFILGVDAQLAPLSVNGGPTRTHRLPSHSPAIDAGSPLPPGSAAADACPARDQRGVPRPQTLFHAGSRNNICDLGAYEAGNLDAFVTGFVLVNADTNSDIGPLRHGDVLNLSELPPNLSIRAQLSDPGRVGSVTFGYDDVPEVRTENRAPYAIAGDSGGDYAAFNFGEDGEEHTVRATPFADPDAGGSAGGSWAATFLVVEG